MEIPGYDIQRLVAQGGTSSVFVAVQRSLGRQVALKILRPLDGPGSATRFLEEGRIVASLNHRNVITIHDVGVLRGWYYIAMEYLEGGSLESRVNGGMDPAQALELLECIARCLDFVHRRGVVHRDIKPANILFHADGTVRLTDFGIAKQLSADQDLTLDGRALGSPFYLSPEQAQCRPLDGRSDIYSLGIVFYELLTGRKPFAGSSHIETILAHLTHPVPALPPELAAFQGLLDHMIAKSPAERFPSASELTETVSRLRTSVKRATPSGQRRHRVGPASGRWPGARSWAGQPVARMLALPRRRLLSAIAPVMVLLAVTAGLLGYRTREDGGLEVPTSPGAGELRARDGSASLYNSRKAPTPAVTKAPPVDVVAAGREEPGTSPGEAQDSHEPVEAAAAAPPPASSPAAGDGSPPTPGPSPETGTAGRTAVPAGLAREEKVSGGEEVSVEEWLRLADEAIRDYRLTTPRNDSALSYYQSALQRQPGNRQALAGLGRIADTYLRLARRELAREDRDRAGRYIERGLSVVPGHEGLEELEAAMARPQTVAVVEAPEADDPLAAFFSRIRQFVTHPASGSGTEWLNQ